MENRNYRVKRNDVCVGEVIKTSDIYRYTGESELYDLKQNNLYVHSWISCRSMLFVIDAERRATDLLYQSPTYPILNVTDDDVCLSLGDGAIVIQDAHNLEMLLAYFGYGENLSYKDILRIRRKFFTGHFAMDNCELFGWDETKPKDLEFYSEGQKISDPKKLLELRNQFEAERQAGHRLFGKATTGILPDDYWVIDDLGDKTLLDAIHWHEKMNAFAPHKEEGMVRKLKRF